MRNLFLALLLVNLGFVAWTHWLAESPASTRFLDRDLPGIRLVSELDPDEAAALAAERAARAADQRPADPLAGADLQAGDPRDAVEQSEPAEPADPAEETGGALAAVELAPPAERCVSVGPFRDLSQAAVAASNLRAAGHSPSQRVADGEIWVGYWVFLDGIPTVAEANEVLARVREGGVSDSYVIPGSETGSIVSVGVFSEISRAGRRREELRELGYEPTVTDRTQRATVYWVDVTLAPEETLDFDALQTPGRIIRLEQRACPAAGV